MITNCSHCGKQIEKTDGHYNRAKKLGRKLFCNKICFGVSQRTSLEDKKKVKSDYDKSLRQTQEYKDKKAERFKIDYAKNPDRYKQKRIRRYKKHLEYLRTPEYKEYKKEYDKKYRAALFYGEFSEAAILLNDLENILDSKVIKYEQDLINKTQKRKRQWKTNSQQVT